MTLSRTTSKRLRQRRTIARGAVRRSAQVARRVGAGLVTVMRHRVERRSSGSIVEPQAYPVGGRKPSATPAGAARC